MLAKGLRLVLQSSYELYEVPKPLCKILIGSCSERGDYVLYLRHCNGENTSL